MNKSICFFEPDEAMAERLIDYWVNHGLEGVSISYYSDKGRFLEDYPGLSATLWILDSSIKESLSAQFPGRVLWWTDQERDTEAVFKYRSAAVMVQTIQEYLGDEAVAAARGPGAFIIGLYSPIRQCLQTTFCVTLSHLLSRKGRTLYLNLEGYSGFEGMLTGFYSRDISDFIYYINHSKDKNPLITTNFIYRLGQVDMIPPVLNPANLHDITEEMWLYMLLILQKSGLYDFILVDISDFVHGSFGILRACQTVFSLCRADTRAGTKWQQYQCLLEETGFRDVIDKTRKLEVPQISVPSLNLEGVTQGPFTEFVERAAKEAGIL